MSDKIQVTETQLMLFDMILGSAIRILMGEYKKIINADETQLEELRKDIDIRFNNAMNKIKQH